MERPPTSKARGVCKFYQTPRGCFAGDACKFLHGTSAILTPYDQAKTCRYFAQGFCKHGDRCWFRHISPKPIDSSTSIDPDEACSICFEKPPLYGLLTGCSHTFCISCLKEWRDPKAKSYDVVLSGVHKKCPMCRAPSKFVTPSHLFYKQGDPEKERIIIAYKESMARVPCRYFAQSKARNKDQPFCPFGKDCFYQHLNDDGSTYVFAEGVDVSMRRASEFRERRQMYVTDSLFSDLLVGVSDGSIRNQFNALSQLLRDSRTADAISDIFQGLLTDHTADTRERPTRGLPPPPPHPEFSTASDAEIRSFQPILSWPLQGLDLDGDVVVTIHELEDLGRPPPELVHSSVSGLTNPTHDPDDDDLPALQSVSDSDDSDDSDPWSDDGDDDDPLPHPVPPPLPSGPFPAYTFGRYPRVVFDATGGFRLSESDQPVNHVQTPLTQHPSDSTLQAFAQHLAASILAERPDSMPPLQSLTDSESEDDEDAYNGDDDDLRMSNPGLEEVPKSPAQTEESRNLEQVVERPEVSLRPFTTDGRGRVIAASEEDSAGSSRESGRSFISRVFDVLF